VKDGAPVGSPLTSKRREAEPCRTWEDELDRLRRRNWMLRFIAWIDFAWSGQPASIPFTCGLMMGLSCMAVADSLMHTVACPNLPDYSASSTVAPVGSGR
jgi:hypothetical protein